MDKDQENKRRRVHPSKFKKEYYWSKLDKKAILVYKGILSLEGLQPV